ncbi:hypothetical protein EI005_25580, partial [Escherichia coli]|nr:hypothetical protein [Escherichia coli]
RWPDQDSVAKVREGLARQKREQRQGWFQSWFNSSPWFTTSLSAYLGPLIILFLLLTFGPYILNRLAAFIKALIGDGTVDGPETKISRINYREPGI